MPNVLAATLPVLALATASIEAVRTAAVAAGATGRIATEPPDPQRIAAGFGSDKLFRQNGSPASAFAPASGFFEAADGWVRTHANYPHHAARLAGLLDIDDPSRDVVADAIRRRSAADLEDAAAQAGAIVLKVRDEREWLASATGEAAGRGPLVDTQARSDSAPLTVPGGARPLAGIRVLDMTRVIAGPVCTRTLALLGATVLRIDPPRPAEIAWQHLDTGQGKLSAVLDVRGDLPRAQALLDGAHVLVTGYRPGAVEALGLRMPPGVVRARVNAWGDDGPWQARRGFDSVVQAATGIALLESRDGETPGALPVQALDHASGYFLAAGITSALMARSADGRGRDVRVALARTAHELLHGGPRTPDHPPPAVPSPDTTVAHGDVVTARPAVPGFDDYPFPAQRWGSAAPSWP